ncbi:hypothetical protein MRX96_002357 [Rhipicephalus microplus]
MQDNPAAVTASFTMRTPLLFTFDNPAQWTAWLQQFEDYSFASGLSSTVGHMQPMSQEGTLRGGLPLE